ncbi:unnamed protein product [Sphenostylis stenocarpa]|uniref:Zinc finger LSD1-type domain-containing protein n=1 Tax=Sphenostylis stenocarpa TaxID=92480 RepID=A0AA86SDR4_9FABA|nr:unnamed protein product [Sphenostylis stenocarpa]
MVVELGSEPGKMQNQPTEKEEDDEGPPPGWQPIPTHPPPQPPQSQPPLPRPCWGQMVCGSCHRLLSYPRGAKYVKCSCCQTVNIVLEGCLSLICIPTISLERTSAPSLNFEFHVGLWI